MFSSDLYTSSSVRLPQLYLAQFLYFTSGVLLRRARLYLKSMLYRNLVAKLTSRIWLVTSAIADVCIALALIFQFRHLTSYASLPNVRSVIQRLLIATIKTGSATSIVALTVFTLYIINPKANLSLGLGFILGRLYSLTMLANLNARNRLQGEIENKGVNCEPTDWLKASATRREQQLGVYETSLVHIVKTVHIEDASAVCMFLYHLDALSYF